MMAGGARGLKRRRAEEMNHDTSGPFGLKSPPKNSIDYESLFKVSEKTFRYICELVGGDMLPTSPFLLLNGKPMTLYDQVAVALRRLGSGESLATIGDSWGLAHSTVSHITWRFVEVMEERAMHHLQWPSTEAKMSEIKSKFESIGGLPNCCGAIDATHIIMCLPASEINAEVWLDHNNRHSMMLQAIVDPDMRFMDIVTGWPGQMADCLVFEDSQFKKRCDNEVRLNGKTLLASQATGSSKSGIREYIIGDSGYPLLPYLVVPYGDERGELTVAEQEFNMRHREMRMVAQRALAKLKYTWRIIHGITWRPDKHRLPRIILVCCLLHNIIIDMKDDGGEVDDEQGPLSHDHDFGYQQLVCECERADQKGGAQRENLCRYLAENMAS